jgi:hypothetical protein
MLIRSKLSSEHLDPESKDLVKVTMGLVATMSALVLGLMVASAKSTFDTQRQGLAQLAGNVIFLDRILARYGPQSKEVRETLRSSVADMLQRTWPGEGSPSSETGAAGGTEGRYEGFYDKLEALKPTESQRALHSLALKTSTDIAQARWLLFTQIGRSIPTVFLVVVVSWVTILFASFSALAPRNRVTVLALLVAAMSVAAALFLILELESPFSGLLQIPSTPLRSALEQLGR